jgi:ribonuclease P protein component
MRSGLCRSGRFNPAIENAGTNTAFAPAWLRLPVVACSSVVAAKAASASAFPVKFQYVSRIDLMENDDGLHREVGNDDEPHLSNSGGWAYPKTHRLLKRRDFLRVYEEGICRSDKWLWIYILEQDESQPTRIGITVTRKVGKAVRRNKVRRRIREIARLLYPRIKPGHELVINCAAKTGELEFDQLKNRVENLLSMAKLLKSENDHHNCKDD